MSENRNRAPASGPRRESEELMCLVFGGFWPAEAGLEALLDRIEGQGAVR